MNKWRKINNSFLIVSSIILSSLFFGQDVLAQPFANSFMEIKFAGESGSDATVKLMVMVALLSLSMPILMSFTPFAYFTIVFSMTRQAIGAQNIPPNQVLVSLALFFSIYVMFPTLNHVYEEAWKPLEQNEISTSEALEVSEKPLKKFVLDNTYEKDLALLLEIRNDEKPSSYDDVSVFAAIPAFLLTQVQKGLFIGMIILWTFAFVDMIVAALLMYMGMMMLPPVMLSLPFKILIFIYLGGYSKITELIFRTVNF